MHALDVHAGPRALQHLREHGPRPADVRVIPAAAGGPKGLAPVPLDQSLFGEWLTTADHLVRLLGASIGAWRMACAGLTDPAAALAQMADDYIHQDYEHAPGQRPARRHVGEEFGANLERRFAARAAELLAHRRFRLHVFTSRGRHRLRRDGKALSAVSTPLAHLGAFATNAVSRRAMGAWWERVVFSDRHDPLPFRLDDYRTRSAPLSTDNLATSVLASCSIPYWLAPVHDISGGPRGAYWDGGIVDYHLHLNYASMPHVPADEAAQGAGLVLCTRSSKAA